MRENKRVVSFLIIDMKYFKLTIVLLTFLLIVSPRLLADESRVVRALDGDTLVLDNGERVRLIGVDTTEKSHPLKPIEYFSEEATQFMKRLLEGQKVKLEYDKEKRGKYGRLLAYVYLLDGTFVNAEIIRQGYGFAYTKYPFKYKDKFVALENEAQKNDRGYWKLGGKRELEWIIGKDQRPFEVFQMSQKLWGVKHKNFIKTRLNDDHLIKTLKDIRLWSNEFHEDDLREQLLNSGWETRQTK